MMKVDYTDYFKEIHKKTYTEKDIRRFRKFIYATHKLVQSKVPVMPGADVLEIGSAQGGFYSLLDKGINYTGIELDPDAAAFAGRHFGEGLFLNVSLEEMPEQQLYDIVFAFEVLEHLRNPLDGIEKIFRLLKPGGVLCGSTPYPFANYVGDKGNNVYHLFVLHPKNWKTLLQLSGFHDIETRPMTYIPFLWRLSKHLNPVIPAYCPFNHVLSTTLLIARKPG